MEQAGKVSSGAVASTLSSASLCEIVRVMSRNVVAACGSAMSTITALSGLRLGVLALAGGGVAVLVRCIVVSSLASIAGIVMAVS